MLNGTNSGNQLFTHIISHIIIILLSNSELLLLDDDTCKLTT